MKASDLSDTDEASNTPSETREIIRAKAHLEDAIDTWRRIGESERLAESLYSLGSLNLDLRRPDVARTLLEEALAIRRCLGHGEELGVVLHRLGSTLKILGEPYQAKARLAEAQGVYQGLGDKASSVQVSKLLSLILMEIGDP